MLGIIFSSLSLQYRASGDDRFKQRIDYIVDELALIQSANGNGYLCAQADGKQFWADLASGNPQALKKHRVPCISSTKCLPDFADAFQLAESDKARQVLIRLADWAISVTAKPGRCRLSEQLEQEHAECARCSATCTPSPAEIPRPGLAILSSQSHRSAHKRPG